MPIVQTEFDAMMADESKRIAEDLRWREDQDHAPAVEFRAEVRSDAGYPLLVNARYNPVAETLSYTLIHRGTGRVYALDLGADHHNPTCDRVGEKHKHGWTDQHADKLAYVPDDITAGIDDPIEVWHQFCVEAKIVHQGMLEHPPAIQEDLLSVTTDVCEALDEQLGALFECRPHKDFIRVRTPFLYPDGGVVDVFVRVKNGHFTISDLGEALGWLKLQSVSSQRSSKQQRLLQDICLTLGVELFRGQLVLRGDQPSQLSESIVRLGQAVVRVSDLWFTMRTRSVESVTDEVADVLQEQRIPFERGVKLAGRSGRDWTVDFHTFAERKSALIFVLATGSRAGARRITEHVVAGWHDLSPLRVGPQPLRFVSLFDDTADVWSEEDFRLVESISDIGRWSRPDELIGLLEAA